MNATELADELENTYPFVGVMEIAATMLRAQADLINCLRMGQPNIDYDKELLKPTFVGRELTDEEIKSEAKYFCHSYHSENPERLVLFARAILRKAQK